MGRFPAHADSPALHADIRLVDQTQYAPKDLAYLGKKSLRQGTQFPLDLGLAKSKYDPAPDG
jgi:hypothetical protein